MWARLLAHSLYSVRVSISQFQSRSFLVSKWQKKPRVTAALARVIHACTSSRQLALNFFILILPSQAWAYVTNNKRRKEVERWREGYTTTAQINMIQTTRLCVSGFSAAMTERRRRGTIVTGAWTKRCKGKGRETQTATKMSQGGERPAHSLVEKNLTHNINGKGQDRRQLGKTKLWEVPHTTHRRNGSTARDGRALHTCIWNTNVWKCIMDHALVDGWSI